MVPFDSAVFCGDPRAELATNILLDLADGRISLVVLQRQARAWLEQLPDRALRARRTGEPAIHVPVSQRGRPHKPHRRPDVTSIVCAGCGAQNAGTRLPAFWSEAGIPDSGRGLLRWCPSCTKAELPR